MFGSVFALRGRALAAGAAPEIDPTSSLAGLTLVVGSILPIPGAPLSPLNLRADSPQVPRAGSRPEGRDCSAELAIPLLRWLLLAVLFLAELIGFRFRSRRAALGDNARWWAEFKVARQTPYIPMPLIEMSSAASC